MNRQRIEELAVQSGLAQAADVRAGFIFPPGMEKFAELLIQECARIVPNTDLEDVDGGDSAVLRAASDQIKEHFGVE
jgi:hypothetical protein